MDEPLFTYDTYMLNQERYIIVIQCAKCLLVNNVIDTEGRNSKAIDAFLTDAAWMAEEDTSTWREKADNCRQCGKEEDLNVHCFKKVDPQDEMESIFLDEEDE